MAEDATASVSSAESWSAAGTLYASVFLPLLRHHADRIEGAIGDPEIDSFANQRYLAQHTLSGYVASLMQPAFSKCFKGMSESDIDRVLQAFAFKNCQPGEETLAVLKKHFASPV